MPFARASDGLKHETLLKGRAMRGEGSFTKMNEAKADLKYIYNQRDPRAYFRELSKLDYVIPGTAKPLFKKLIERLEKRQRKAVRILDLGCSYGVNAAMLKHDMTMPELYAHWAPNRFVDADPDEVLAYDKCFFDARSEPGAIEVVGLDQAENAVTFAEESGLIDEGVVANLEVQPLPELAKEGLAPVDLVTSTGCVGYVTERTFERLLPTITKGRAPWFANFVLRLFPFDKIELALAKWGYLTEKLEGRTFVQRRFASEDEQRQIVRLLHDKGIDPAGKEADGYLHAEFYLSRPAEEVRRASMSELLAP